MEQTTNNTAAANKIIKFAQSNETLPSSVVEAIQTGRIPMAAVVPGATDLTGAYELLANRDELLMGYTPVK